MPPPTSPPIPEVAPPFYETHDQGGLVHTEPFRFSPRDGPLYIDGSVIFPRQPLLSRGGWSIVQACQTSGQLLRALSVSLGAGIPARAIVTEHLALWGTAQYAPPLRLEDGSCLLHTVAADCMAVVFAWAGGQAYATRHSYAMAGFMKQFYDGGAKR